MVAALVGSSLLFLVVLIVGLGVALGGVLAWLLIRRARQLPAPRPAAPLPPRRRRWR